MDVCVDSCVNDLESFNIYYHGYADKIKALTSLDDAGSVLLGEGEIVEKEGIVRDNPLYTLHSNTFMTPYSKITEIIDRNMYGFVNRCTSGENCEDPYL